MAGENDGGTQAATEQQAAVQEDAQGQQQAGQADTGVGKHTKTDADGNAVGSGNGGATEGKHSADKHTAEIAELKQQRA